MKDICHKNYHLCMTSVTCIKIVITESKHTHTYTQRGW